MPITATAPVSDRTHVSALHEAATEHANTDSNATPRVQGVVGAPHTKTRADLIMRVMVIAITACLFAVGARVAQLQIRPSKELAAFIDDRAYKQEEPGVRGDIKDSRGRLLAATRMGERVFVDPMNFPNPPGEAMAKLAEPLGMKVEEIAARIVPRMSANVEREEKLKDTDPTNDPKGGPSRYVTLGGILEDWQVAAIKGLKIKGVHTETRSVREVPAAGLAGQLLGKVGIDHDGLLGVEKMANKVVEPTNGSLTFIRDARRRPLWVEEGGFVAPQRGQDVRLSIDLELQRAATEELTKQLESAEAAGGRLVAMNPRTGEILAMVDLVRDLPELVDYKWDHPIGQEPSGSRPRYRTIKADPGRKVDASLARNRCVEDIYEPGSTFKPFMWSATTALGLATPNEIFDTEDGHWRTPYGRPITDVAARGQQSWTDVLVNSSNIGMTKGTARMSFEQMRSAVTGFGFGSPVKLGLPGESNGKVTSAKGWTKYTQTSVAMGYEVAVTPVQMVRAFAAFARTGAQAGTVPEATLLAAPIDGPELPARRVIPAQVAELTRRTMKGVTENLERKVLKNESENYRYDAFGKSGTAQIPLPPRPKNVKPPRGSGGYFVGQYNVSFICGAPVENPRIVVLVVVDDPGPRLVRENRYYGAMVAGPAARRFVERALSYMGVPPVNEHGHTPVLAAAD